MSVGTLKLNEVRVGFLVRFFTRRAIRLFYDQYSLTFGLPKRRHKNWVFAQHKDSIVQEVSEDLHRILPKRVLSSVENLRVAKSRPYLILRDAAHVGWSYPGDDVSFAKQSHPGREKLPDTASNTAQNRLSSLERKKRVIDTFAGSLLWLLGAQVDFRIRPAALNSRLARNMVTGTLEPQLPDRESRDMALRFHQSTTEYQLPYKDRANDAPLTCSFKMITCMTNIRRVPIFVMPVREVLSRLPAESRDATIRELCESAYVKSGPRADIYPFESGGSGPVLMKDPLSNDSLGYLMSLDPARIWGIDSAKTRHFLALRRALRAAADAQAYDTVLLGRRDILIVDNQRALLSRREFDDTTLTGYLRAKWAQLRGNPYRWLRIHYGFPSGITQSDGTRETSLS